MHQIENNIDRGSQYRPRFALVKLTFKFQWNRV